MQASGVKGAFRDWFYRYYEANGAASLDKKQQAKELTERIFGKEEGGEAGDGQAGAISITDARLLAFPVRSNVSPFVWVTCPAVLTRLNRDLGLCSYGKTVPDIRPTNVDSYITVIGQIQDKAVVMEDLAVSIEAPPEGIAILKEIITDLVPQISRLLLISDQNFSFLVQSATEVQPQIKINIETGTAKDGSLRYQELLPSDSVLYSLVFYAKERIQEEGLLPEAIRDLVVSAVSTHIQMGGDITLGRGLMEINWFPPAKKGDNQ